MVSAGTLGGKDIISGGVTVGTGAGSGALLSPGAQGTRSIGNLTSLASVSFGSDGTYQWELQGNTADQVIADGAFINPGAQFSAVLLKHQSPSVGTVLTIIDNTSANPIAGAFTNLPDGAIITVEGNNLRANYEGRDGNDLTLTVVP